MKASIIIPTYNRKETLIKTINRLYKSTSLPDEIIIIDQSETPFKLKYIDKCILDKINIKLILLDHPSSTKARNIGIENAKNEAIIFMDDDLYVDEFTIEKTLSHLNRQDIGLVDAIHCDENKVYNSDLDDKFNLMSKISYIFGRKKLSNKQGYFCKASILGRYNLNNSKDETEWAMGYFFAVKKSLLNMFDIRFDEKLTSYAYAEDLDFTYRYIKKISEIGIKAIIDNSIYVNHIAAKEYRIPSKKALSIYIVNRWYLSYKYFKNPIYRFFLLWSDVFEFIRRVIYNQYPIEVIKRHIICIKNRKKLKKGILEEYMYR